MDFPTIYQIIEEGYNVELLDGSRSDRASSGKLRSQELFDEDRYRITFRVAPVTGIEVANIRQFYQTQRNQIIGWTDPFTGIYYDVEMYRPPIFQRLKSIHATMQIFMDGVVNSG